MLRVHFTADDLVRTRVAAVGPLDETACAIWLLQRRDSAVFFDGWRQQTLARLMPAARLRRTDTTHALCIAGRLHPQRRTVNLAGSCLGEPTGLPGR